MKKILTILPLVALVLTGCPDDVDIGSAADYIYVNESSAEITVRSFRWDGIENNTKKFVLPVGEQHTMRLSSFGSPPQPFFWIHSGDYITISNGEKIVTQRYGPPIKETENLLYRLHNYTFISGKDLYLKCSFTFTDEFFDDGVPVE